MSALAVVAVVAVACWLALLTLVQMLTVRQIGLVTVRLDRERAAEAPVLDGLDVGSPAPPEVTQLLPPLQEDVPVYALILGGSCSTCRDLVRDLADAVIPRPTVALIGGQEGTAHAMTEIMPATLQRRVGPQAAAGIEALQTRTTPSVYEVTNGVITGKAALRGAEHLIAFMRDPAPDGQLAITKVGGR